MSYASLPKSPSLPSVDEPGPSLWHSVASSGSLGRSSRENLRTFDFGAIVARWSPLAQHLRRAVGELAEDLFEDEVPPSDRAVKECNNRLLAAASRFSPLSEFPVPQLSTSGDGGLSCEWPGENKRIVLAISKDGESRLSIYEKTNGGTLRIDHVPRPSGPDLEGVIRSYP